PSHDPNLTVVASAHTPFLVSRSANEELWLAPDGSGRLAHDDGGPVEPASTGDRAVWRDAGSPPLEGLIPPIQTERPLVTNIGAGAMTEQLLGANGLYDSLAHDGDPLAPLPHDAAALARWLHEHAWERRIRSSDGCAVDGTGCSPDQARLVA